MVARTNSGTSSRQSSGNEGVLTNSNNKSHQSTQRDVTKQQQQQQQQQQDHRDDAESDPIVLHFSEYPKIDQAILNMKSSLGRFTRANDRRMVLRTLKDVKYLKAMPIESRPSPMVELEEMEMEVAKENLVLNGQSFYRKTKYGRTSTDFLHVLHELCYQICETAAANRSSRNSSSNDNAAISALTVAMSPDTLYYDLLGRLARTITSADCYAKLNDILGSQDLILMNSSAERKPKSKMNSKGVVVKGGSDEMSTMPPIDLNIFEEGGNIHAHIVTTLGYGLYRKLDVNTGRPWIKMQGELNERHNFSTSAQVRHVTVHWPDMYV